MGDFDDGLVFGGWGGVMELRDSSKDLSRSSEGDGGGVGGVLGGASDMASGFLREGESN